MPSKSTKAQASTLGASKTATREESPVPEANASKVAIDTNTLQAFRDIVKEVIKEENDSLREEIIRAVPPINTTLEEYGGKLRNHDQGLTELDTRLVAMEANYQELKDGYEKLQRKTDDLENSARRYNLRVLGVPEGLEQGNPTRFMAALLQEVFGGGLEKPPMLDRAHRAPAPKPPQGGRPRPFIVCFHYYREKELIQSLAREKSRLDFRDGQLLIFPDFSADLTRRRTAFNEVKEILRKQEGVRYGLLYPARMRISFRGETKVFNSPEDVKGFIDSRFGKDK
uniref:LINE-1 type transposase domain containing 1 n=2 Tax=Nothobranchius kadleci TaxID=1051664 RepID=A0A1A8BV28_NOTKA